MDPTPFLAVRRTDPVTGLTVRITGPRPRDPGLSDGRVPDLEAVSAATAKSCPFCGAGPWTRTPRFPPALVPEGRIRRGDAVLFPNLAPYGPYSSVTTLSPDHHVPLGRFTAAMYRDALGNCLELASRVAAADLRPRWAVISQNVLPSSGGALFHPHLQVNLDDEPVGYHRMLEEARARHGRGPDLLDCLARDAFAQGRGIGRSGEWAWFTPFAPLAAWEVQAVLPGPLLAGQLQDGCLDALVAGLLAVEAWYAKDGRNALNLGLFLPLREPSPLLLRLMIRSTFRPWYRSDRSCYEIALYEGVTDRAPESQAAAMRADGVLA